MTNRAMPPFELPPQSSTPASVTPVLNIAASILGQPWHWRSLAADARDPGYAPDDLVTQLLLARGCPRAAIDAHKAPSKIGRAPVRTQVTNAHLGYRLLRAKQYTTLII